MDDPYKAPEMLRIIKGISNVFKVYIPLENFYKTNPEKEASFFNEKITSYFSWLLDKNMREIIRKIFEKAGCYASFDALTNRIKIFGAIKAIKAVELEIDNCFGELKFKKDFELNGVLSNEVLADPTIKKIMYDPKVVFYYKYREKRLTIETSDEALLKEITTAIDVYCSGHNDLAQSSLIVYCMLCFEQAENPYTLICKHTYCWKCLEDYFDDSLKDLSNFPITLPCDECMGQFISIVDISNLTR